MTTRTHAIAATWQSPSPVRPTTRNLSFTRGDDVTLAFTVYSDDTAETLLDVSGATAVLTLWEDGGPVVLTATGTVTDGPNGEISITLPSSQTEGLVGRNRYQVQFSDDSTAVLVEGVIQVTSLDVLATPSDTVRNGDQVIYGPLIVSYIQPHHDTDIFEIGREEWGEAFRVTLNSLGQPAPTDPAVGTTGHIVDVLNRFRSRFIATQGATYALDAAGVSGPRVSPLVLSSNTNFSGTGGTGTNAPVQFSIASDVADLRSADRSLAVQVVAHNFGGTGTYGARTVQRLVLNQSGAFSDLATNQQHTVLEAWFNARYNAGGTGTGENAKGFAYTFNPQVVLYDGATHWALANGLGEVNVAIKATRRAITLGGTVTAGDVMTVTFSGAGVTNSPVAVTFTTGTSQTLAMVGNGIEAAINASADLKASSIAAIGRLGVVTIHYPYGADVSVAVSTSGGATTTMTLGDATGGASASTKLGASIIRLADDGSPAAEDDNSAALLFGAQPTSPQSGGWVNGVWFGGLGTYAGGQWPMRHDSTLIGAGQQLSVGNAARSARMAPNLAAYGVDFRKVYFSDGLFAGPGGFAVKGPNIYLGGAVIQATEAGLVIDVAGKVASAVAIAGGGGGGTGTATGNYFVGDLVQDSADGLHIVGAVNPATGAVTSLTTLHMPSCRGSAPSNPLTTTGGSGTGLTINATWPSGGDTISIAPSGGDVVFGGPTSFTPGVDREDNITATGSIQSDAYALTKGICVVTAGASGTGVRMGDMDHIVMNRGSVTLNVYPPTGAQIESYGTNTAISVLAGDNARLRRMSATMVRLEI